MRFDLSVLLPPFSVFVLQRPGPARPVSAPMGEFRGGSFRLSSQRVDATRILGDRSLENFTRESPA